MLYYLFDALAEGIDDDDEELKFVVNLPFIKIKISYLISNTVLFISMNYC